jgi:hypothetical protein
MGVESFTMMMRARRYTAIAEVDQAIRRYRHVQFLRSDTLGVAYEYADGDHLFEVLLRGCDTQANFDLSIRFALCNPDSIESHFAVFVRWAIQQWQPTVIWLMSSKFRKTPLSPDDYDTFLRQDMHREIEALRESWQASFGRRRGPVRVCDAYTFARVTNAA